MENMKIWNELKQPPKTALKKITGGRLIGMTDIKPQWRYQALTELFGPCGFGWRYEIVKEWTEPGSDGQVFAFADINFYYKHEDTWSEAIPGTGGSMLVTKESKGLHNSDEAFKMAVTDALSVACKMIGVAADIYSGFWDGSKYNGAEDNSTINKTQYGEIVGMIERSGADIAKFKRYMKVKDLSEIPSAAYGTAIAALNMKLKAAENDS